MIGACRGVVASHHHPPCQASLLHGRKKLLLKPTSQQPKQLSVVWWTQEGHWTTSIAGGMREICSSRHGVSGSLLRWESRLHIVKEKAKVSVAYYVGSLLPMLVDDCKRLLTFGFVFQQDGAPAHTARQTQDWLTVNCTDYRKGPMATKFTWPQPTWLPCVGRTASGISPTSPKAKDHSRAKKVSCSRSGMTCHRQRSIKLSTTFGNVGARVSAGGGHFEHTMWTSYWNVSWTCVPVHKMLIMF